MGRFLQFALLAAIALQACAAPTPSTSSSEDDDPFGAPASSTDADAEETSSPAESSSAAHSSSRPSAHASSSSVHSSASKSTSASASESASESETASASESTTKSSSSSRPSSSASGSSSASSAQPSQSAGSGGDDIQIAEVVGNGIQAFINNTGGLDGQIFVALEGWRGLSVDEGTNENEYNQIVFDASDAIPSREKGKGGDLSFSQLFTSFVQNVTAATSDATGSRPKNDTTLRDAAKKQSKACSDVLLFTIDDAIKAYQLQLPPPSDGKPPEALTDWKNPEFIKWAESEKDYSDIKKCFDADNAFQDAMDDAFGDSFDLISATNENIRPIVDGTNATQELINMPIADPDKSAIWNSMEDGQFVPLYSIPTLRGTLKSWIDMSKNSSSGNSSQTDQGKSDSTAGSSKVSGGLAIGSASEPGLEPVISIKQKGQKAPEPSQSSELKPAFSYDSTAAPTKRGLDTSARFVRRRVVPANTSEEDVKNMAKTFGAARNINDFRWRGGADPRIGTVIKPVVNGTAASFKLNFAQITRMNITTGKWFDGYRSAAAIRDAAEDDEITAAGKPVFEQYFGEKDTPGTVAYYNTQALVVFQPSWEYTFSSSKAADAFNASTADNTEVEGQTVRYRDTTNNAYIIGYLQRPFWN